MKRLSFAIAAMAAILTVAAATKVPVFSVGATQIADCGGPLPPPCQPDPPCNS